MCHIRNSIAMVVCEVMTVISISDTNVIYLKNRIICTILPTKKTSRKALCR